jgi:hypothetical protein
VAALLTVACNQTAGGQPAAHASSPRTVAPAPPGCMTTQSTPAAPDGVQASLPAWVLAGGLTQPDDLYFDRDGSVLVGEYSAGRIAKIGGPAGVERLPHAVGEPEGIARIEDVLYVADQQGDRVLAIDASGNVRTFLQLAPVAGILGLDQIAATADTLIVPDSPRGTLLFVSPSGQVVRRVGDFARPTGAWPLSDGSVLVADENANAVYRLATDGSKHKLASLAVADDVVETADGRIFAISESNGQLIEVGKGQVVTALKIAQGVALDGAGNLLVTEHDAGRLDLVLLSFRLVPFAAQPSLPAGQPVCVQVARAPGFADAVELQPGQGYKVVRQPAGDQPGAVMPDACSQKCSIRITAASGRRSDGAWLTYANS